MLGNKASVSILKCMFCCNKLKWLSKLMAHLVRASLLGLCRPEYRGFKSLPDHQLLSVHLTSY